MGGQKPGLTMNGHALSLSQLAVKVVMTDFWTPCQPCRREASALAQVYGEYASASRRASRGRSRLEELLDLCAFYERELPGLLEHWEELRRKRKENTR